MKLRKWVIVLSILFLNIGAIWAQNPLKIYCIDVNQSDATLIVSPTNKYVLIDAGDIAGKYGDTVFRFIRNLGITHLDYTIATHYHADHIGGFPVVICSLSRGPNRNDSILYYCYDRGDSNPPSTWVYDSFVSVVGSKRRVIALGETLDLGGGAFMVCVARNGVVVNGTYVTPDEENDRCIAFVLKYGQFEFFIGGDLSGSNDGGYRDVESKIAPVVRNVDVLRVNHHGSKYSSNRTFLDSLRPEVSIISLGNNSYGYPFQEVIDSLVRRNSYIYQLNNNPSGGGTIPSGAGRILDSNAVITVDNIKYIVNGDTYPIDGVRRDGAVLEIISPIDTIAEGTIITPQACIKNFGNITESFPVRFRIGSIYNKIKTISNLAPNDTITAVFDSIWTAVRGNYQVKCSTEVPKDLDSTNDRITANLTVAFYDAELKDIIVPAINDTFFTNESISPKVIVKDSSEFSNPTLAKIYCQIKGFSTIYLDSVQRTLIPGNTDTITFTKKSLSTASEGNYTCSTWVVRNMDLVPNNNIKTHQFYIKSFLSNTSWSKLESLPGIKGVKSGGALVADTLDKIYAFEGNNTRGFFVYDINDNSWSRLESIPYSSSSRKRIGKGASLVYNKFSNPDIIYAIKGNNTLELWEYNVETDTWSYKTTVPIGLANKKVKGGAGMAFVKQGNQTYIYLLKGNNTTEFYGYHCQADTWMKNLQQALSGPNTKSFKDGSCITTGSDNRLYVLKGGAKYNEFYYYDIVGDTWIELESIPRYNPISKKKTKVKDGAALCYNDDDNVLYAFKGGNSQDFWMYDIGQNKWFVLDTLPRSTYRKKIGSGGALTYANNKVYALKGNKTLEFWSYDQLVNFKDIDVNNNLVTTSVPINSFINNIKLNQNIESAIIRIYSISGQLIKTNNFSSYNINELASGLKPGIYFIQIKPKSPNIQSLTKKVVIP